MGVLCGQTSGLKIFLGEGGDVELDARTSKQILLFALDPLTLTLSLSLLCAQHHSQHHIYLLVFEHRFILLYSLYAWIVVCASLVLNHKSFIQHLNPYLGESRGVSPEPFTGNSATLVCCTKCVAKQFLSFRIQRIQFIDQHITYSPPALQVISISSQDSDWIKYTLVLRSSSDVVNLLTIT